MTNYEKHKDEIIKHIFFGETCNFKKKFIGIKCGMTGCKDCVELTKEWLEAEYVEPEVDWSKVPMGTPVRVWNNPNYKHERAFVVYSEKPIARFITADLTAKTTGCWKYAELIEVDNESNTND